MKYLIFASKCVLLLCLAGMIAGCGVPKSQHAQLQESYQAVKKEMAVFNQQVTQVQKENADLKSKIAQLEDQLTKLQVQKNAVESKYQDLLKQQQAAAVVSTETAQD